MQNIGLQNVDPNTGWVCHTGNQWSCPKLLIGFGLWGYLPVLCNYQKDGWPGGT